jgi:hypothetical protein
MSQDEDGAPAAGDDAMEGLIGDNSHDPQSLNPLTDATISSQETSRLPAKRAGKRDPRNVTGVDRRHFTSEQLIESVDGTISRRKKEVVSFVRLPEDPIRASPEDRRVVHTGRQVADDAGLRLEGMSHEQLTKLGTDTLEQRQRLMDAEEACRQLECDAETLSDEQARQRFMGKLAKDDTFCKRVTGEKNMRCLKAKFDYLNCRGVLDRLQHWTSGETQVKRRSAAGRKRILTSFQSYTLFKGQFRNGSSSMVFLADSLGISVSTAGRIYQTYLRVVAYIMGKHQPWPTAEAMRLNVDVQTRNELGVEDDVIVMYGDATERPISRPSMLGSSTHSDYHRLSHAREARVSGV